MKKIVVLAALAACFASAKAQVVLTYETHGLLSGTENAMQLTTYCDPGPSGENVTWDFSDAQNLGDFQGRLLSSSVSRAAGVFSAGNTTLEEFGNLFVFAATTQRLEQWGYLSGSSNTRLVYSKPFVKMIFPFSFGSHFNGDFAADYYLNDVREGVVEGSYDVKGDGTGTLILPDGKEHRGVLRVQEVKSYTQTIQGKEYAYVDQTFRWYSRDNRYPLMVLVKSSVHGLNGKGSTTSVTTRAAYNSMNPSGSNDPKMTIKMLSPKVTIYPNPFTDKAVISIVLQNEGSVSVDLFDASGRLLTQLAAGRYPAGEQQIILRRGVYLESDGVLIVRVRVDGEESAFRVVQTH